MSVEAALNDEMMGWRGPENTAYHIASVGRETTKRPTKIMYMVVGSFKSIRGGAIILKTSQLVSYQKNFMRQEDNII